ncbi:nucleocapsid [Tai virus]|uniref:Nucleocapsid n=1 Tax=Tai virus TaxID=1406343 RepID=U5LXP7_9VIRU|nr:nucleocapsid [Tai virus]AGX32052.1 nucleocapsid [Tai virus]
MSNQFTFTNTVTSSTFKGDVFYTAHENDTFLAHPDKVKEILAKGVQLKRAVQKLDEGASLTMKGFYVKQGVELTIYKGGPELNDEVYTFSRLQGMCACYVYINSIKFPDVVIAIARSNGFEWKQEYNDHQKCAYLSFTPGAHLFSHIFGYWPIACALYEIMRDGKQSDKDLKVYQSRFRARDSEGPMMDKIEQNSRRIKATFESIVGEGGVKSVAVRSLINKIWP